MLCAILKLITMRYMAYTLCIVMYALKVHVFGVRWEECVSARKEILDKLYVPNVIAFINCLSKRAYCVIVSYAALDHVAFVR